MKLILLDFLIWQKVWLNPVCQLLFVSIALYMLHLFKKNHRYRMDINKQEFDNAIRYRDFVIGVQEQAKRDRENGSDD